MKQSPIEALYAYWSSLKGEATAPRRFDIEPSRIVSILPHTFILEKLAPRDYRYRIAGTAICDAFGLELRDAHFLDGWSAQDYIALERALAVVTRHGGIARFALEARRTRPLLPFSTASRLAIRAASSSGTDDRVTFEGILLPLTHTQDTIDRILGALAPIDAPEWLGTDAISAPRVTSLDVKWPRRVGAPDTPHQETLAETEGDPTRQIDGPVGTRLAESSPKDVVKRALDRDYHSLERQAPFLPQIRKSRIVRSDRRQFRVYDGGLDKTED